MTSVGENTKHFVTSYNLYTRCQNTWRLQEDTECASV